MQETSPTRSREAAGRPRRSYRILLASSIFLAAIGAPILMQGAVVFAQSLTPSAGGSSSILYGFLIFALSATPLVLAGYAWKRTQGFMDVLDDE